MFGLSVKICRANDKEHVRYIEIQQTLKIVKIRKKVE